VPDQVGVRVTLGVDQVEAGQHLALQVHVVGVHPGVDHRDRDTGAGRNGPCVRDVQRFEMPLLGAHIVGNQGRRLHGCGEGRAGGNPRGDQSGEGGSDESQCRA
jgi:hypothetical protein